MKVQSVGQEGVPLLPSQSAFVVQFRVETDVERRHSRGRIEHVVSGRATSFRSWRELQAFVNQVLIEVFSAPADEG